MRIFKALSLAAFLSLISSFPLPAVVQEVASDTPLKGEAKSLIRMDLLQSKKTEAGPPQRNIFAPRARFHSPIPLDVQQNVSQNESETFYGKEGRPTLIVNIRYIGFIESPKKIIALIIFEGKAMAVAEGEVLSEGVRVGGISPTEIEVIMPDSTTRKFSLEGE
ncbi:MAG: hypothetical protein QHH14_10565 [Clostridiales bacterium]|jgi:hypothetical protein|nr:hypothetical protein [Clostridiales bacterium]